MHIFEKDTDNLTAFDCDLTSQTIKDLYENAVNAVVQLDEELCPVWQNKAGRKNKNFFPHLFSEDPALREAIKDRLDANGTLYYKTMPFPAESDGIFFVKRPDKNVMAFTNAENRQTTSPQEFDPDAIDRYMRIVRNNINSIALFSSSAEQQLQEETPEAQILFTGIKRSCYRVLRNAQNSAIYSRYAAGGTQKELVSCDVGALVEVLCTSVCSVCKDGVPIRVKIPERPIITAVDLRLAESAILNVLLNAMIYTRDGNEIDVSVIEKDTMIFINVSDRGAGIKRNNLPFVKQPYFSREPADDGGVHPGLGMGLTIAAIFCLSHSGAMVINSEFGEGTTVAMSIKKREGGDGLKAEVAGYVTNRFSPVYIEMCDICEMPL